MISDVEVGSSILVTPFATFAANVPGLLSLVCCFGNDVCVGIFGVTGFIVFGMDGGFIILAMIRLLVLVLVLVLVV